MLLSQIYYCQQDDVCLYRAVSFIVPFTPAEGQTAAASIAVPVDYAIKAQSPANNQITLSAV